MSRHRNVRKLDYKEEYGYEDVYGRSLEDEVAISPSTAAEFIFHREQRETPSLKSYFDSRDQQGSLDAGWKPQAHSATSPLATVSAGVASGSWQRGEGGKDVVDGSNRAPSGGWQRREERETTDSGGGEPVPRVPPGFKPLPKDEGGVYDKGGGGVRPKTEVTRPPEEVVSLSPTPVRVSTVTAPKRGFVTLGDNFLEEERRIRSGSSSPARTPSPCADRTPRTHPPPVQRSISRSKHQQIDVVEEYKKREETGKGQINLVVIGHVDAGKSTLMGHLLFLLGHVSKKAMHKYEQESQKVGKGSFAYAWVLDETGEERNRGITMDVAQQQFETQNKLVTLLDAPGHKDFIPNMITGAAQADVGVLVVGSAVGEFESGFESGGQTREHALLARSLGVRQLAVAVNKMDTVDWSELRFSEIVQKLKAFLKQAGFKDSDVSYVPCSGLTGENVTKTPTVPELISWYHGPTLLERIDHFTPPLRPVEKPFRCCIADIFKAQGAGLSIAGRIESGHMQLGDSVLVQPANEVATIRALSVSDDSATWAVAGDQIVATIAGIDITKLSLGSVLCSPEHPVRVTSRVQARIIVFNIEVPITTGFSVILHYQSLNEPAVIRQLISLLNKNTGELIKKKPRCLSRNSSAVIELEVSRPVCLELYQDCKELGRFMLRSRGNTIAAGMVTKIL